jgi:homoserine/homoserine lactone efflux protein
VSCRKRPDTAPTRGSRGVVGIQIGNLIFFLCIAFGLVTLLAAVTNAFVVLQIGGAAYLLYLGSRIIISSLQRTPDETAVACRPGEKAGNLVVQALVVQLTNPKALLFVSALVPQFLDPERQLVFQIAILLSCTVAVDTVVLGSYVLLADRGTHALRRAGVSRWIERTFGLALVGLGVGLLDWRK